MNERRLGFSAVDDSGSGSRSVTRGERMRNGLLYTSGSSFAMTLLRFVLVRRLDVKKLDRRLRVLCRSDVALRDKSVVLRFGKIAEGEEEADFDSHEPSS